jgi:hypothetical protein
MVEFMTFMNHKSLSITLHQNTRFLWIPPGGQQKLMNIATLNRGAVYACSGN